CAAILGAPHKPQPPREAAAASPLAERLMAELADGPRRLQWLPAAQALTPRARAPLAGFLLDIALRRAARALDLAKVRDLLIAGVEARVPPTPLRLQAAELLSRLAECAPAPTLSSRNGPSPCPGPMISEPAERSAEAPSA